MAGSPRALLRKTRCRRFHAPLPRRLAHLPARRPLGEPLAGFPFGVPSLASFGALSKESRSAATSWSWPTSLAMVSLRSSFSTRSSSSMSTPGGGVTVWPRPVSPCVVKSALTLALALLAPCEYRRVCGPVGNIELAPEQELEELGWSIMSTCPDLILRKCSSLGTKMSSIVPPSHATMASHLTTKKAIGSSYTNTPSSTETRYVCRMFMREKPRNLPSLNWVGTWRDW
mmetsp:Transcript_18754/g.31923  ORF Transcript_18754/g.31923 Transcript_18754/m.31923 type:complete len:229 (+) Transcript_18754:349-1035(+)